MFDGHAIWVLKEEAQELTRIRAHDGKGLGTVSTSAQCVDLAFDGNVVWAACQDGQVRQFDTNLSGQPNPSLNVVNVGASVTSVAYDGALLWAGTTDSSISLINPLTATVVDSFAVESDSIGAMAFDGSNMWVITGPTVRRIQAGANAGPNGEVSVENTPADIVFDGSHIWVANEANDTVSQIDPVSVAVVGSPIAVGNGLASLVFDGTHVWVANSNDITLTRIHAETGQVAGTFGIGFNPTALAFDGANLWAADFNGNLFKR